MEGRIDPDRDIYAIPSQVPSAYRPAATCMSAKMGGGVKRCPIPELFVGTSLCTVDFVLTAWFLCFLLAIRRGLFCYCWLPVDFVLYLLLGGLWNLLLLFAVELWILWFLFAVGLCVFCEDWLQLGCRFFYNIKGLLILEYAWSSAVDFAITVCRWTVNFVITAWWRAMDFVNAAYCKDILAVFCVDVVDWQCTSTCCSTVNAWFSKHFFHALGLLKS